MHSRPILPQPFTTGGLLPASHKNVLRTLLSAAIRISSVANTAFVQDESSLQPSNLPCSSTLCRLDPAHKTLRSILVSGLPESEPHSCPRIRGLRAQQAASPVDSARIPAIPGNCLLALRR